MPELEELGFLEEGGHGPLGMYFNTEFVLKKTNVKEYPFNFIALHGVRQFTQKTERARGFKDRREDIEGLLGGLTSGEAIRGPSQERLGQRSA